MKRKSSRDLGCAMNEGGADATPKFGLRAEKVHGGEGRAGDRN